MRVEKIDEYRRRIPAHDGMLVDAEFFTSDALPAEESALEQLSDAARIPSALHVLGMPDIHQGYGVPIGAVVGLEEAVVPAAVGYDINCGMRLILTPLVHDEVRGRLERLAHSLRRDIPLGEGKRNVSLPRGKFAAILEGGVRAYLDTKTGDRRLDESRDRREEEADMRRCEDEGSMPGDTRCVSGRAMERGRSQLGTLGGGNHFVEIQRVERVHDRRTADRFGLVEGRITIMIHSGSRGFGHQVGGDYMRLAAERNAGRSPNRYLCFLDAESEEGRRYIAAMHAAANFAFVNRQIMTAFVRRSVRREFGKMPLPVLYDVPHNIAKRETHFGRKLWVHRKGATRAYPAGRMRGTEWADVGQPVLIPGSMGTASYVLVGTEASAETLHSVNHGAGRTMSRSAARGRRRKSGGRKGRPALISDEQFDESMRGIVLVCENRRAVKEEAPAAYKDIDEVIRVVAGAGLAQVVCRLVPLAVLKG